MTKSAVFSIWMMVAVIIATSCKKSESEENVSTSSKHYETKSHNNGEACLSCHNPGGSGEGNWVVAGSVYTQNLTNPNPNGTIYLYGGTGNLIGTIEVDGNGNFYTTASLITAAGVYPQIKSASGNIKNMSEKCVSGNCNYCHGTTTAKIWVD